MFVDFVLMDPDKTIEEFANKLGFSKLIFQNDFNKAGFFFAKDYSVNRQQVESGRIKVLVNPHINENKDSLHFRVGGLDQVICKIASLNNIAIGFSLDSLNNPVLIGRIKQNIKLCRKFKVRMLFFTFAKTKYDLRSAPDLLSLLHVFGMTGNEAKTALSGI